MESGEVRKFEYEGPVYIRPLSRGILLLDRKGEPYLDDIIEDLAGEDGYCQVNLSIMVWPNGNR